MCSDPDFTQEKVIFIQLQKSPLLLTAYCCSVTKRLDSGINVRGVEDMKNCIFEIPHGDIKCVLSIKGSNFNEKKDQHFHIYLRSGPRLTPPSPLQSA